MFMLTQLFVTHVGTNNKCAILKHNTIYHQYARFIIIGAPSINIQLPTNNIQLLLTL